ncbi:class I SAM-dependent methyltransferase [uncultured Corynebacterium sp.]|uniref:class I SAM-dependent methyltransferase n=1 Tax=uncultured Corynebacterium sp. TaxID=159447 RepID=UPI0025D42E2E|nr:methyltransferase domain-containing protein [uncultured Corynebacterium sp.]
MTQTSADTTLPTLRRRATLRRSLGLLTDFRFEQSDPDRFYSHLAADTVGLLSDIWVDAGSTTATTATTADGRASLAGTRILDVGGGPGYFGRAFAAAGVAEGNYVTCEPDVGEMAAAGIRLASSVRGSGMDLPFADAAFDLTYSSNVAEHVSDPWRMADEMLRVTKPGGLTVLSYTCWLGPFGGHETGLWQHYVGGEFAARRYERKHGNPPKNRWGESLFDVSCADGLRYASAVRDRGDAEPVASFPRYHPWWAWWMVKVPGLREVGVSNLVTVLRRT